MALIVWDGFDQYAALADLQSRVGKLAWNDINASITFQAGRGDYGQCVNVSSGNGGFTFGGSFGANFNAAIPAIAMLVEPQSGDFVDFKVMDYTTSAPQITFRILLASGTVVVFIGDSTPNGTTPTQIAASPPNACNPYVWQKYEIKVAIGAPGSFDFHVNGSSVISSGSTNTQATANAWFNGLRITGANLFGVGGPQVSFDDFNLNDLTTGPGSFPCNTFIGDCATRTLRTAANSAVQWTPIAGTNWGEVNEVQFDGDATYNYATTIGDADLLSFGSLPTTVAAVFGVQVTGAYRKLDASAQTILQGIKSSGATASGAATPMSLNYTYVTDLFVLDPNTSATWTPTAVNALLGGYTLNS
jgi:hypothetical protein